MLAKTSLSDQILPIAFILMFPADLVASFLIGTYPSQASLMSLAGTLTGVYLLRKLWWGGAERLSTQSRLRLVNQQGQAFDPSSDDAQILADNARVNLLLGAGLLIFALLLTICFVGSYLVTKPISVTPTPMGLAVQIGIGLVFNLLVIALEAFGTKVYLHR